VDGQTLTESFEIVKDSRLSTTRGDLQAQFDLLKKINARVSEAHVAINQMRDLRQQVEAFEKRLKGPDQKELAQEAKQLREAIKAVEDELIQEKGDSPLGLPLRPALQLAALTGIVESADAAPTRQQEEVYEDLAGQIDEILGRYRQIMETDLQRFNDMVRTRGVMAVAPAKAEQREPELVPAE
jgi:DNA repair exonuclease SbcCD ATPase subunit